MARVLSDTLLKLYSEDGAIFPIRVLSRTAIDVARERLASVLQDDTCFAVLNYKANLAFRWLDDIAHLPSLLDVVEDLIGPDILLWSCSFAIKRPRSPGHFTWHQDATYWGLMPPVALTCWLAFCPVGPENGGVRFLLGSHRLGVLPHRNKFGSDNFLSRGQEIEQLPKGYVQVVARLKPGEISAHDALTAHCSGPNESDSPRIGCLLTFIPTYVRHERFRESAMLMRGADRFGYHDLEDSPSGDMQPADLEARRAAMEKMGTYQDETLLTTSDAASTLSEHQAMEANNGEECSKNNG